MLIQSKYRCINCFKELNNDNEKCSCGFNENSYKIPSHTMAPGTILNGKYCVGRVLGEGGFGITYVGYDLNLDLKVAIKEFFMNGYNSRTNTVSNAISVSVGNNAELFETNRDKFINEAKILAKLNQEEGIVTVHNFFQANNTAYIVMEFLNGQTLKEYLDTKGTLSENEAIEIFTPVINSLSKVHSAHLMHRDISPDNIMITDMGNVKLLDFGAARENSNNNKSFSVVLKHGYAPIEQYQTHGKQGSWTDVYALCATMYKCLTGITPVASPDRVLGEVVEPVYTVTNNCSKQFSDVVMKGMEAEVGDRYQSMQELADAISEVRKNEIDSSDSDIISDDTTNQIIVADIDIPDSDDEINDKDDNSVSSGTLDINEQSSINDTANKNKRSKMLLIFALIAIVVIVVAVIAIRGLSTKENSNAETERIVTDESTLEEDDSQKDTNRDDEDTSDEIAEKEINEKEEWLLVKDTAYSSDGSISSWVEYDYDNKGNQIKMAYYLSDGSPSSEWTEYEYDERGNKTKEIYYSNGGADSQWNEYEYDKNDNQISDKYYDMKGMLSSEHEYIYGNDGNIKKEVVYASDGSTIWWIEYEYSNGNQTKKTAYQNDSIVTWSEYEYDTNGNMIKEIDYGEDESHSLTKVTEYDKNNNPIKITSYNSDGSSIGWSESEYDAKGNLIKFIEYYENGLFDYWDEYEYDENGNKAKYIMHDWDDSIKYVNEYEYILKDDVISQKNI